MLGLSFRVVPPAVDESRAPAEVPEGYVTRLAREKAATVAAREPGAVVLAADTTVVMRGHVFGKPETPQEAAAMLKRLEGRKHQVMTAVAVAQDGRLEHALDVTDVTFRRLSDEQIAAYVATGEPLDKAGAYADRKSTRLNSSHLVISYAVFCLKKKKQQRRRIASHGSVT